MPQRYTALSTSATRSPPHLRPTTSLARISRIRPGWTCLLSLILLVPFCLLLLSLITYLSPGEGYMRPCLPFSLSRISKAAHQSLSCQSGSAIKYKGINTVSTLNMSGTSTTATSDGRLAGFLQSQKDLFIQDLKDGKGKGWTVAMGNEAGDLDSLSSSIAFAYLSSALLAKRTVPLHLTPSSLMHLRPENLLALETASVPPSVLLHPELLGVQPIDLASQGVTFALVDHNRLLPMFGQGQVDTIIDHHEDEGEHVNAQRLIQVPTGSASSLVAKFFSEPWKAALSSPAGQKGSPVPPELATLLLSSIVIDTAGLKDGGKATPTDHDAAAFLYPLSTLGSDPGISAQSSSNTFPPANLLDYSTKLLTTKFDVGDMSTHDLLLRDYKEYKLPTASTSYPYLQAGLSTVPLGLKKWLEKEPDGWHSYIEGMDRYMEERELDIEGVLTTFKSDKKGKNKREILLVVRSGGAIKSSEEAMRVRDELIRGFEQSAELELETWGDKGGVKHRLKKKAKVGLEVLDSGDHGRWGVAWKQGNVKATRKQVAPILRDLVAKLD